jgi:hypothetical protein
MADLSIQNSPGETVLRENEAVYARNKMLALGYRPVAGHLRLTSSHLIFLDSASGETRSYPLCHIIHAGPSDYHTRTAAGSGDAFTQTSTLMRISFSDGGREYFAVKDIAGWTEAINTARGMAPIIAYTDLPNRRSGVETTSGQIIAMVAAGLVGLCILMTCCATLILFSPVIIAMLNSGN